MAAEGFPGESEKKACFVLKAPLENEQRNLRPAAGPLFPFFVSVFWFIRNKKPEKNERVRCPGVGNAPGVCLRTC